MDYIGVRIGLYRDLIFRSSQGSGKASCYCHRYYSLSQCVGCRMGS